MKAAKQFFVRLTVLILFLASITAIVLYQAGVYDISFIKRPSDTDAQTDAQTASPPPDTGDIDTTESTAPGKEETTSPPDDENKHTFADFLNAIPSAGDLEKEGWSITPTAYTPGKHFIARAPVTFSSENRNTFSFRDEQTEALEKKVRYITDEIATYTLNKITIQTERPVVKLCAGMITVDFGDRISLIGHDGSVLIDDFDAEFTYTRDQNGRPLVYIDGTLYSVNTATGELTKSSYDMHYTKGIIFDAPVYYAQFNPDIVLTPFWEAQNAGNTDPAPQETEPPETKQEETEPPETQPAETEPAETEPAETEPEETQPEETEPENTEPAETQPAETEPVDIEPDETDPEDPPAEETTAEDTAPPETERETAAGMSVEEPAVKSFSFSPVLKRSYASADDEGTVLWGYMDYYSRKFEKRYLRTYDFADNGYAAVVDLNGFLRIINSYQSSKVYKLGGYWVKPPELNGSSVYEAYLPAPIDNKDYLGMYYFDSGYIRMRLVYYSPYYSGYFMEQDILIDETGAEFPIPAGYKLKYYSEGVLTLEKNGLYGYYDHTGRWISEPVYTDAGPFLQGLAVVCNSSGKYGMIDTEGNTVLEFGYDYISDVSTGIIAAFAESIGWEVYTVMTK